MKKRILDILSQTRPEYSFTDSTDFIAEGLLDSFDIVQLVTSLEEAFNISIDGVDIIPENFSSIDKIVSLITKKNVS